MTLEEAQKQVDTWIRQIGGGYFSELTNLGVLVEEVGELARWIVRQYGDQNRKPEEKEMNAQEAIEDELTDILWVLICLANQMNIDLTSALQKNIQKKTIRDQHRHKKN
ncbi:MAG TPA: nucleotide pyrophosphohydrolase [Saprospiraceae bacterium]|nr:nucleotide pyrophosphohydrolase [Saprospiraceae bacterium]